MIAGVGVDIIVIARFDRPENEAFDRRCFTKREINYLRGRGLQSKAGLFAAKEAVVKALGTGFRGFWPHEVEILHDEAGAPYVYLHGNAAAAAKKRAVARITISITHHQTTAAAIAVAERRESHACRIRRANAKYRRSRDK